MMKIHFKSCCISILFLLPAMVLTGCNPSPDADGKTDIEVTPQQPLEFPETVSGQLVADHYKTIFTIGPDAEANYQASLVKLREKGGDAINVIMGTYYKADKALYADRAMLIETLSELRLVQARESLLQVVNEKLPERAPLPDDALSERTQELIIRTTAIRGLGHIAITDDEAAKELGRLARLPEMSLYEQARVSLALVIQQEKDRKRLQWLISLFPGEYTGWLPLVGVAPPAPN